MRPIRKWAAAVAAATLILTVVGTASAATVYGNIPSPLAGNYPSQAFEATSTSEFGGLVELAAGPRTNPVVTVTMSSWGCQNGGWTTGDCLTTPGAVFSEPITLNIYAVNADDSVGDLLASDTQTFKIPFRPSAAALTGHAGDCPGTDVYGFPNSSKWYDTTDSKCYYGLAHNISWDLGGQRVTLPDKVIVSVMYNTSDWGYQPIGTGAPCHGSASGCGYDSLNVAVVPNAPFFGTDPLPDSAYVSSLWSGAYCSGSALGVFRLDTGCWTGYRPAIQIDTYPLQTGPAGTNGTNGSNGSNGSSCTVVDNGDGTKTISCGDGTSVTVSDGTNAAAPAVAATRPQTKLVKVRIRAAKRTATFRFSASGGKGKLTFQCRLDKGKYKTCRSGKSYKHLKRGKHVFRVRAKDASGNVDQTPATRKFKL